MQLPAMPLRWFAASVNRTIEAQFSAWIRAHRPQDAYMLLRHDHFPLEIDVRAPDRVGTDRLAAAVAANELRVPQRSAIVVDAGTAVTVDLITSDGVFRGGAILPGIQTAAQALADATDALPLLENLDLSSVPAADRQVDAGGHAQRDRVGLCRRGARIDSADECRRAGRTQRVLYRRRRHSSGPPDRS